MLTHLGANPQTAAAEAVCKPQLYVEKLHILIPAVTGKSRGA